MQSKEIENVIRSIIQDISHAALNQELPAEQLKKYALELYESSVLLEFVQMTAPATKEEKPVFQAEIAAPPLSEIENKNPEVSISTAVEAISNESTEVHIIENTVSETEIIEERPQIEELAAESAAELPEITEEVTQVSVPPIAEEVKEIAAESPEAQIIIEKKTTVAQEIKISVNPPVAQSKALPGTLPSLLDKLQKKPIADLKKAIGINDRFAFVNELFKGNTEAYNRAIEELNHLESFQAALTLIQHDYMPKYKWNEEEPLVLHFLQLVERRYL